MNNDISSTGKVFDRLKKVINVVETFFVSICLCAMVVTTVLQIFMRNALDSGFSIGDPLIKHLVLWTTLLGAGIATREFKHIKIDVADRVLPEKAKPFVQAFVDIFSSAICAILLVASIKFLKMENESGTFLGATEMPIWIVEIILPLGFAIVGIRFLAGGINKIVQAVKRA